MDEIRLPYSQNQARSEGFKIAILLLLVFVIGAIFYHVVEGFSYVNAIYFTAMTLSTVGYGDLTPQTDLGKLFTTVYAFVGIAIFFGAAAALFRATQTSQLRINQLLALKKLTSATHSKGRKKVGANAARQSK